MRKITKILACLMALVLTFFIVGCDENIEISFENEQVTIVAGAQLDLDLVSSVEDLDLVWISDDVNIVTVNNGKITGINPGEATVTVNVKDKDISASILVKVNPVALSFSDLEITIKIDEERTLVPTVSPEQAISYTWQSSNLEVVTVVNGKIKGIAVGNATISAAGKGGNANITVNVVLPDPTKVTITNPITDSKVGEEVTFNTIVLPIKASQETIWESSDINIAVVNEDGKVIFIGIGEVTITAKSQVETSIDHSIVIEVDKPDPITITVYSANGLDRISIGDTLQFSATVSPELAAQGVVWSTSNNEIATIDANGLLTALKIGGVMVTATSEILGSVFGEFFIGVVLPNPTSVVVTTSENVIQIDEELQLSHQVLPALAAQTVTYISSDNEIATVDSNGKIVGIGPGEAIITVYSVALDVYQSINIKVVARIGEVSHNFVYVDESIETERYSTITINNVEYIVGINAFNDFGKVLVSEGTTIYVAKGTYSETLTITHKNITIIGPNKDINPNAESRNEEAILSGKIFINNGIENITINGLAFTLNGAVEAIGTTKNVLFAYNNIYDTTKKTLVWSALRDYTLIGFLTFWKQGIPVENITIEFNKFDQVSGPNIMIGNTNGITIRGNVFTNFDRDAVRIDGGFNFGTTLFENNTFANDELGGYNGIYFRSIGASKDSNNPNIIIIRNNLFKNIGHVNAQGVATDMSGAISTNGYQEFGTDISILNNTFETCANYIFLRNNASATNHSTYSWVANVNYNIFKGVPIGYYHKNRNATDTASTNPALVNFDFNFFGDADGNFVEVDVNKFNFVGSLKNTFNSFEEMD